MTNSLGPALAAAPRQATPTTHKADAKAQNINGHPRGATTQAVYSTRAQCVTLGRSVVRAPHTTSHYPPQATQKSHSGATSRTESRPIQGTVTIRSHTRNRQSPELYMPCADERQHDTAGTSSACKSLYSVGPPLPVRLGHSKKGPLLSCPIT